jgi:hypothetical protein
MLLLMAATLMVTLLAFFVVWAKNLLEPFRAFTVTVANESEHAIISVETGIRSGGTGNSKHLYEDKIETGSSITIKPKLRSSGEGVIYQKFVFADGNSKETIACGYTEYVSGHSTVTIRNDRIEVEQDCM